MNQQDVMLSSPKGCDKNLERRPRYNIWRKFSTLITCSLETFFFWYGAIVSRKPGWAIFFCLFLTSVCSLGLINFTTEDRPFKLWIPQESEFVKILNWRYENFPQKFRVSAALFTADNVLEKEVIGESLKIHTAIANLSNDGLYFTDFCAAIPKAVNLPLIGGGQLGWLASVFRQDYCSALDSIETACMERTLLEIWGYDQSSIDTLSNEQIISDVNSISKSMVTGHTLDPGFFLGGISRDENGEIIGAKAMVHMWITEINMTSVEIYGAFDDGGTGMRVDKDTLAWEKRFNREMEVLSQSLNHSEMHFLSMSSFGEISMDTIEGDVVFLLIGFLIVFLYVQVMLGKFNFIECRPLLSFMGITCVYLSVAVSYGIMSSFNVPYGPVNHILPFLLLGLGIDDMFVIVQSWKTLPEKDLDKCVHTQMALALKHAGVSITITSITDFMAFAIGCTTVLPALRSFCLYAAVGIVTVYFFQATFFVAWFSLDQRRLMNKRNGLCWCCKHTDWNTNSCSQKEFCQSFFKNIYSHIVTNKLAKAAILLFTTLLLSTSVYGFMHLRQEFNPMWFLPKSSYMAKYLSRADKYFPEFGHDGIMIFSNISLHEEIAQLDLLVEELKKNRFVGHIDAWYDKYKQYWKKYDVDVLDPDISKADFDYELGEFLFSPEGLKYKARNFKFLGNVSCVSPSVEVEVSSIEFRFEFMDTSEDRIEAMETVKAIASNFNTSGNVWAWARIFSGWETDKIIEVELYRNLGMAVSVVFLLTLILITSFTTSLMVLLCVVFTLLDVMALMYWWGLTIDTVSCIDLVLAVGLCVDYSAHVAHTFMTERGTRDERVRLTLAKIGPAVLNGGFSTFLAFVLLASSDSHVFITFFKIFFGVTLYGLYHGLVFLPVILSIIGPAPYEEQKPEICNGHELQQLQVPNDTKCEPTNSIET